MLRPRIAIRVGGIIIIERWKSSRSSQSVNYRRRRRFVGLQVAEKDRGRSAGTANCGARWSAGQTSLGWLSAIGQSATWATIAGVSLIPVRDAPDGYETDAGRKRVCLSLVLCTVRTITTLTKADRYNDVPCSVQRNKNLEVQTQHSLYRPLHLDRSRLL